jgi:hypothetical protein
MCQHAQNNKTPSLPVQLCPECGDYVSEDVAFSHREDRHADRFAVSYRVLPMKPATS